MVKESLRGELKGPMHFKGIIFESIVEYAEETSWIVLTYLINTLLNNW